MPQITQELAAAHDPVRPEPAGRGIGLVVAAEGRGRPGRPARLRALGRAHRRAERGLGADACAITLSPSLAEPFLTFSSRRDLREAVWRARVARGAHDGEHDNRPVAARIVALRQELAALHGYASYADYALADRMAQDTAAVLELLRKAWEPAKAKAAEDRALLTAMAQRAWRSPRPSRPGTGATWPRRCGSSNSICDDAQLKPYFALDNMIAAMFDCAGRLFGLRFVEQADPAPVPPRRAAVGSAGPRRRARRHLPGRQLRPPVKAQRRVDERFSQPVGHRRRHLADRRQQQQLRQGQPHAAELRRRRGRCSTNSATGCTACCRRCATSAWPAPACCATSSSCPRSCSRTGRWSRRSCSSMRATGRPASRSRRI